MDLANKTEANCSSESPQVVESMDMVDSLLLPCIAVFGILGNLFSIAIFQQGAKLRRLASSVYLMSLALSDSTFLFTLLLSMPALHLLGRSAMCKTIFYFMNVSGVISSWLVVLFTVERFVVIMYPLTRMAKCSRSRARYLVLFLLPAPCLMHLYSAAVLIDVDSEGICQPDKDLVIVTTVLHCVDISLTYFIPAFIVVALNVRIGVQLIRSSIERREMRSGSMTEATSAAVALACKAALPASPASLRLGYSKKKCKSDRLASFQLQRSFSSASEPRRSRVGSLASSPNSPSDNAITRTLIVISTSFALLNLPHNVVLLVKLIAQMTSTAECAMRSDFVYVLTSVCNFLYYANFGVNIVVYHMTSSNYREGAKELIARILSCFSASGRRILLRPPAMDNDKSKRRASSTRNGVDYKWQQRNLDSRRSLTSTVLRRSADEDPMLLETITEAEVVDNFRLNPALGEEKSSIALSN